jgi:hypothetical protein
MVSLMSGFALDDDAVRSPNENYNLGSLHRGIRSCVRVTALAAGESKLVANVTP